MNTADDILAWFRQQAEEKIPIEPQLYLEAATKLNILSSDENDLLIELESKVAELRKNAVIEHGSAAKAKIYIESDPLYKDLRKQQAKIKRIEEQIRLAKKIAQIRSDEMRNAL